MPHGWKSTRTHRQLIIWTRTSSRERRCRCVSIRLVFLNHGSHGAAASVRDDDRSKHDSRASIDENPDVHPAISDPRFCFNRLLLHVTSRTSQVFPAVGWDDRTTIKPSNFAPHGNFGPILARSVASLDELCTKHEHQNEVRKSKVFMMLFSFFCRMRFDDSKPFWKKGLLFPWGLKL